MNYLMMFFSSLVVAILITPILMKISYKLEFTDKPTERKIHKKITPLCGGMAMYISFFFSYFSFGEMNIKKIAIFIASTMILVIGLIDDYYKSIGKEFPISPRLIIQILAAVIVYAVGIRFRGFTNPMTGEYIQLASILQFILSITWMFGVTTVINWSDGMDGLAGGISFVSTITFFIAAIILRQQESAFLSLAIAGAILGFLVYNAYPAKIFMGDSGANFLGFILSIIALDGAFKQATVLSLILPILALAVPIFDNIFVIVKRHSEGKAVYEADRSQIHFRLERKGLKPKQIVGCIVLISIVCSLLSIVLLFHNHY